MSFSSVMFAIRRILPSLLFLPAISAHPDVTPFIESPKQLESSLHHDAMRHPELEYEVYELPQVPGNVPRSGRLFGVTESFVKTKPYLIPVALLDPIGIGSVVALGIADRRYTAKSPMKVGDGFFSQPQNAVATGR
jgi:hypothetical protein